MNKALLPLTSLATFVLVVGILRVASNVLIPIALATLLAFLLTPLVIRLQRWRMPKVLAVALTATAALSVLAVVAWIVTVQLIDLAQRLPDYERNIQTKIDSLQDAKRPAPLRRMIDMIDNLRADMQAGEKAAEAAEAARSGKTDEPKPVPVEVRPARASPVDMVRRFVGPLLGPLGTAGIAIVLVVAMLLQREDLRDRFIKVISAGRLNVATEAMGDAARRVSRYLFLQLVVNATYGLPVGIGLYFIGIPNALLWGLMATVLRFIPFLGPWIAALFPVILAAAVAPGWEPLMYTILLFVVMELISNNVIELWLYGSGTGISNLALLIAAIFWTWVWGPIGLFLSTPMTVCLLVVGKYVPGLRFLSMLLGSEPVLEPPAQFYQRMLAMDYESMLQRAIAFAERRSLAEFYDSVFIPALILAEVDRHNGALAEFRQTFIFESGRELIEDLDDVDQSNKEAGPERGKPEAGAGAPAQAPLPQPRIYIIPARDDADHLVALMLQHLLRIRDLHAEVAPVTASLSDSAKRIGDSGFDLVVISALPPSAITPARRLGHYLRERCASARLLIGIWSEEAHVSQLRLRLRSLQPEAVASRVGEAAGLAQRLASPTGKRPGAPLEAALDEEVAPPDDVQLPSLDLGKVQPEAWFDTVARDLAQRFDVPVSLVTIVDFDRQFWQTHRGLPPELAEMPETERRPAPSLSGENFLVVEDVAKERSDIGPSFLEGRGVRFYACAALRGANGQAVGTLCVIDTKPRTIAPHEAALLQRRAREFMEAVEQRPGGGPGSQRATRTKAPRPGP